MPQNRTSAPRFEGKLKREIAIEAFKKYGPGATIQQVDAYFQKYGLQNCERSMFSAAKRMAEGKVPPLRRKYRRNADDEKDILGLIIRAKQLAYDLGGWDHLEEFIDVLSDTNLY
jgi:hypothetical protein